MRAAYGKLLVSGIPRMTRPRKRKNADDLSGFTVVDPGGNWIRIFAAKPVPEGPAQGKLAVTLENAVVLGDSKGDPEQASKILDSALARDQHDTPPADLLEALVYRAELALRADDSARARTLLDQARAVPLNEAERRRLTETLTNIEDLAATLT